MSNHLIFDNWIIRENDELYFAKSSTESEWHNGRG